MRKGNVGTFAGELEWIAWPNCFSLYYWYVFRTK